MTPGPLEYPSPGLCSCPCWPRVPVQGCFCDLPLQCMTALGKQAGVVCEAGEDCRAMPRLRPSLLVSDHTLLSLLFMMGYVAPKP